MNRDNTRHRRYIGYLALVEAGGDEEKQLSTLPYLSLPSLPWHPAESEAGEAARVSEGQGCRDESWEEGAIGERWGWLSKKRGVGTGATWGSIYPYCLSGRQERVPKRPAARFCASRWGPRQFASKRNAHTWDTGEVKSLREQSPVARQALFVRHTQPAEGSDRQKPDSRPAGSKRPSFGGIEADDKQLKPQQ